MLPSDLKPQQFSGYPPQARKLVTDYLEVLRKLPLSFLPSLLREAIEYDFKFPLERKALERELSRLNSLSGAETKEWFQEFQQIRLSPALEHADWVNAPAQFVEQLSAHLWTTHQMDAFRKAALDYADRLRVAVAPELPVAPRLWISVIGQGADVHDAPLFRKLRPHGAYFSRVKPENGLNLLMDAIATRARTHPSAYAHWYIDGGEEADHDPSLTCVSYRGLEAARAALLDKMRGEIEKPGMGPETLRTFLAEIRSADLGLGEAGDAVLNRFQVKLLTEGSGTQVFSTTFAQWAAREASRRAQPLTLLVRFAPRQRQKPMNELFSAGRTQPELDSAGSLIDADMGSYYTWLNQQRLPGADQSGFLVWFENHSEALAIGPSMARGTESTTEATLADLLSWMS